MKKNNDQSGQAIIEYVIIVTLIMLGLIGVVGYFMGALGSFYLATIKIITLPIP